MTQLRAETFILIPGRSSRQGVTLNEGKYTDGYLDETSTLRMNPTDMRRLGIAPGDEVRMWNDVGEVVVPCIDAQDECPEGLVFICYGDKSSRLMGGETHGSGMPDSKGLDVHLSPAKLPRPRVSRETGESDVAVPEPAAEAELPVSLPTPAESPLRVAGAVTPGTAGQSGAGPTLVMGLFLLALIAIAVLMKLVG